MAKKKVDKVVSDPDFKSGRLNKILSLQRQNDIIQLLLEGKDRVEINNYIVSKYRIRQSTAIQYISEASVAIKNRSHSEVNNIISLHVQRYEGIYALLYEIRSYGLSMRALRQKEKLLGFHKEGFHMRVNSGVISSVQLQTVQGEYDVMKLSKEKQNRMTNLLNKAKR